MPTNKDSLAQKVYRRIWPEDNALLLFQALYNALFHTGIHIQYMIYLKKFGEAKEYTIESG